MRLPVLLLVALLAVPGVAVAYPDPDKVPRYHDSACYQEFDRRFVHDYLGVLPADFASEIEGAACEVYETTSAHYVFVSVADTEGESLETYAFRLFEEWGVGDDERLDGLMMLYVADYLGSGEGALRIEVGYGLEGVLNSVVTERVWDAMIEARDASLDAGQTPAEARALAISVGTLHLLQTLQDSYTDGGFPAPERPATPIWFWILVILVILIVIYVLYKASQGSSGWGYHSGSRSSWSGRSGGMWIPPSGGWGGGGSFGGGGGFGGGRSGGGGRGGRF